MIYLLAISFGVFSIAFYSNLPSAWVFVVFSSGFRHHFGHPHPDVVRRYKLRGSELWSTGDQGAITFAWQSQGGLNVQGEREKGFFDCFTCRAWWR